MNKYFYGVLLVGCLGIGFVLGNLYAHQNKGADQDALQSQERSMPQEKAYSESLSSPKQKQVESPVPLIKRPKKNNEAEVDSIKLLQSENQSLKKKIAELEKRLTTKQENLAASASHQAMSSEQLTEQAMEHLQMLMKKRVMEITDQQLEDFEQRFAQSDASSDWSKDYQVKLESFIQSNNEKGTHYIQDLRCKSKLCRLEIASDDHSAWSELVADMINQPWYSSLMLQKPQMTEAGTLLYFLPERH